VVTVFSILEKNVMMGITTMEMDVVLLVRSSHLVDVIQDFKEM